MFALIDNLKTLFSMCVVNYLEGPVARYDENDDGDILDDGELQNLLESTEVREIVTLSEVDTLEASVDLIPTSPVDTTGSSTSIEQRTLQYVATKILKLRGDTVRDGSIDGNIGTNSLRDIKNASGIDFEGEVIGMNTIVKLVEAARNLIQEKRDEIAAAEAAREQAREEARETLAPYSTIEEVRELERDEIRAVQEALNTLGHNVRGADGIAGRRTETGFNAYVEERREAGEDAEREAAQTRIEDADSGEYDAAQGVASAEMAVATQRAAISDLESDLDDAQEEAADMQVELDAANRELASMRLADEVADEAVATRIGQLDAAVISAESAQAALDAADIELTRATLASETAGASVEVRTEALEAATQAAREAQAALEAANAELARARLAAETNTETIAVTQEALSEATTLRDSLPTVEEAEDILARVQARVLDLNYTGRHEINLSSSDMNKSLEEAQSRFDAYQRRYTGAVRRGSFIERVEATDTTWPTSLDDWYFESALVLAHVQLREARRVQEEMGRLEQILQNAQDNAQVTQDTFEAARDASADAQAGDLAARDAMRLADEALGRAQADVTAAEVALEIAMRAQSDAGALDTTADEAVAEAEAALTRARETAVATQRLFVAAREASADAQARDLAADGRVGSLEGSLSDARAELGVREMTERMRESDLDAAEAEIVAAREAELDAYINDLTNSGENEALVALIEENDGAREMINRLRNMPGERIQALGNALGYFGASSDFVGLSRISADMVVVLIEHATEEGIPVNEMTSEYIIQLNELYQDKADELGEIIAGLNTRGFLDTGRAAAENYFNVTTGYPDFEYVTQEGVYSISNGLRGRPRAHTQTTYTRTDTYMTEHRHHVMQDEQGETVSSTHRSNRSQIGAVTVSSSVTRRWFEMHQGGMEREAISALIASGEARLRPSYQMLQRLYEPRITSSGVELVEQSWYSEMREWSENLAQREEGEMSIVNEDVSIASKTLSGAMNEVRREAPDRYEEIQNEVREDLLASDEFSFLIWNAQTGERANAMQLVGRKQVLPSGKEVWNVAIFNPQTGETVQRENFATGEAMLASDLGQQAIEMSTYRYLGVVDTTTEGGLRAVDDQGLIRCGDHEKVVLLDEPAPVLPQGYNFLRNGLPCGVLGAYCTSGSTHTHNVRELANHEWTYGVIREPDNDPDGNPDGGGGRAGSSPGDTDGGPGGDNGSDAGAGDD